MDIIRVIYIGVYMDNGKENGSCNNSNTEKAGNGSMQYCCNHCLSVPCWV